MSTQTYTSCPGCEFYQAGGKFCSECGTSLTKKNVKNAHVYLELVSELYFKWLTYEKNFKPWAVTQQRLNQLHGAAREELFHIFQSLERMDRNVEKKNTWMYCEPF